jgi:hypothetical protein
MSFFAIRNRSLRLFAFAALACATLCTPALGSDITVASPISGVQLRSPVWIRAHNLGCEGVPPLAFGYSIDNSTTLVRGETAYDVDIVGQVVSPGIHIVHFKSWTARGLCPVVNAQFAVAGPSAASSPLGLSTGSSTAGTSAFFLVGRGFAQLGPTPTLTLPYGVPASAATTGDLDDNAGWNQVHDGGTPGTSRGSTVYPATTPLYDDAREFYMTYTNRAGERWSILPGRNTAAATHFVYDTYVLLPNPSEVLNLELDINHVTSNGQTWILGTQCSGVTGTWEAAYTSGKKDHWWSSSIKCDPRTWSANTWHHIQIAVHRDSGGVVTHDWVIFDGTYYAWNYTRLSAHYLGWEPGTFNVQYQIEGTSKSSGSVTSYIHKMTIYYW